MKRSPAESATPRRSKTFTPRMGVYSIRHFPSGRTLLDWSHHVDGILNRHRFQLHLGGHPIKRLQADWNADGEGAFIFEVQDLLAPDPNRHEGAAHTDDLRELEALWREKLGLPSELSYGPPSTR